MVWRDWGGRKMCGRTRSKNQSIRKKQGRQDEDRWQVWVGMCDIGCRVQDGRDRQTDQNCSCRGELTLAILM